VYIEAAWRSAKAAHQRRSFVSSARSSASVESTTSSVISA
jgi:hypothetical protein